MDHHFHCTACGKCCYGWLPLTVNEAVAFAGRVPLAMVWTPLRRGARSYTIASRIGVTTRLRDRREVAILVVPTAYIPPSFSCPMLNEEGLCSIHAEKPLRCRSMPFYPYQEEADQRNYLIPQAGWRCDTSSAAPVVYRNKQIIYSDDFNAEKNALINQAPALQAYAELMLKTTPQLVDHLTKTIQKTTGGKVIINFSSFLSTSRTINGSQFAEQQIPVLLDYAEKTAGNAKLAEYHSHYRSFAASLERFLPLPSG